MVENQRVKIQMAIKKKSLMSTLNEYALKIQKVKNTLTTEVSLKCGGPFSRRMKMVVVTRRQVHDHTEQLIPFPRNTLHGWQIKVLLHIREKFGS